jgi:hypothetical protein
MLRTLSSQYRSNNSRRDLDNLGLPMNAYPGDTELAACCAFCRKPLPTLNGELQPWRAPNGQFFCDEFCADDAEEMHFRRRGRADRKAHERSKV